MALDRVAKCTKESGEGTQLRLSHTAECPLETFRRCVLVSLVELSVVVPDRGSALLEEGGPLAILHKMIKIQQVHRPLGNMKEIEPEERARGVW